MGREDCHCLKAFVTKSLPTAPIPINFFSRVKDHVGGIVSLESSSENLRRFQCMRLLFHTFEEDVVTDLRLFEQLDNCGYE